MKYISIYLIPILCILNSFNLYAEDSLTFKQQLDRLNEEVKDLNKAVFNKSFEKKDFDSEKKENDTERFTSIDIRFYDLEKDIKNLTLQFEEIAIKIDDLSNVIKSLDDDINAKFEKIQKITKKKNYEENEELNMETIQAKEDNTLGTLVISDNNPEQNNVESKDLIDNNERKQTETELNNLPPEELLQFALNQMMKKNYDYSKKILQDFIISFPENQLSGSAHFWLGKIYLFQSNYRDAAIVFGEGVQKFPQSIKAAEMYYEMAKSLKEMNKIPEACKTLSLLDENYKGNKFTKDPEKIKNKMNCETQN